MVDNGDIWSYFEKYGVVRSLSESVASSNIVSLINTSIKLLRQDVNLAWFDCWWCWSMLLTKKEELLQRSAIILQQLMFCHHVGWFSTEIKMTTINLKNITPQAFFEKYVGLKLVLCVSYQRSNDKHGKSYTVGRCLNYHSGHKVWVINTAMDVSKRACHYHTDRRLLLLVWLRCWSVSDRKKNSCN